MAIIQPFEDIAEESVRPGDVSDSDVRGAQPADTIDEAPGG